MMELAVRDSSTNANMKTWKTFKQAKFGEVWKMMNLGFLIINQINPSHTEFPQNKQTNLALHCSLVAKGDAAS